MNCPNCGAPAKPIAGRDGFHCEFCNTFFFPTSLEESPDGIEPLGETSGVICPACEGSLEKGCIRGVNVLFCAKCRGILVDSESFAGVVHCLREERTDPPNEPRPLDPTELKRHIDCPLCGGPMDVHPYYGPGNAVIDSCDRCGMIWLDYGEMTAIVQAPGR